MLTYLASDSTGTPWYSTDEAALEQWIAERDLCASTPPAGTPNTRGRSDHAVGHPVPVAAERAAARAWSPPLLGI
jgi:hypothetical protein